MSSHAKKMKAHNKAIKAAYRELEKHLADGNWQDADQVTTRLILKIAGREEYGYLDFCQMDKFPCQDLQSIDKLWVEYSDRRFGFSVQTRIYKSLFTPGRYGRMAWLRFCVTVGWISGCGQIQDHIIYDLTAPEGHLPYFYGSFWSDLEGAGFFAKGKAELYYHLENCMMGKSPTCKKQDNNINSINSYPNSEQPNIMPIIW